MYACYYDELDMVGKNQMSLTFNNKVRAQVFYSNQIFELATSGQGNKMRAGTIGGLSVYGKFDK